MAKRRQYDDLDSLFERLENLVEKYMKVSSDANKDREDETDSNEGFIRHSKSRLLRITRHRRKKHSE